MGLSASFRTPLTSLSISPLANIRLFLRHGMKSCGSSRKPSNRNERSMAFKSISSVSGASEIKNERRVISPLIAIEYSLERCALIFPLGLNVSRCGIASIYTKGIHMCWCVYYISPRFCPKADVSQCLI